VHDQDGADLPLLVGLERLGDPIDRSSVAPLGLEHLDVEPEPLGHVGPEMAELSESRRQDLVAGRQRVGEGRLPAACSRSGEQEALPGFALEDAFEIREQRLRQRREARRSVIFARDVHGAKHAVGDVGRSGDE
jgi:hypothetical protein